MFLNYQLDYLLWLQNFRDLTSDALTPFFLAITHLSEFFILILFITLIYWSINKKAGEFIFINLFFGLLCNQILKMMFCISRPWLLSDEIKPVPQALPEATGYSFPSGHTARATAVWGSLVVWLWEKKFVRYFLVILILLVALSRNYLGVHTPQDVIVSLLVGAVILFITKKLFDNIENNNLDFKLFITGILLSALTVTGILIKAHFVNDSQFNHHLISFYGHIGNFFGIITGWYACRKLIPFCTNDISWAKRILRYLFGIGILIPLMLFSKDIFVNDFGKAGGGFIYNFVVCIFVTFFYPWIFTRVERFLEKRTNQNG